MPRCPSNFQCQLIPRSRPRLRKHTQPPARASERWQSRLLAQSKVMQQTNPQRVLSFRDRKLHHNVLIGSMGFHLERNRLAVQLNLLYFGLQADGRAKFDGALFTSRSQAGLQYDSLVRLRILDQQRVLPKPYILRTEPRPI